MPLLTLIKTIYTQLGKQENIIKQGMQDGDVNLTFADISKAKSLLDYQPEVKLEEGIARFIDWYRQQDKN